MVPNLWQFIRDFLDTGAHNQLLVPMLLRAVLVYLGAVTMVRLGEKRFLGRSTGFDILLALILGSLVSRAINGSAALLPTLAVGVLLVGMHWLLAELSFRSKPFSKLVKGQATVLIEDGRIDWDELAGSNISPDDLLEAARTQLGVERLDQLRAAYLERSGRISLVRYPEKPRVVEVKVAEGVQTIRIEFE